MVNRPVARRPTLRPRGGSRLQWWVLGVSALLVSGCGETILPVSVTGVYRLRSANGNPLPAVIPGSDSGTVVVTGGRLTLATNRTFDLLVDFQRTRGGRTEEFNLSRGGTYNPFEESVVLVNSDRSETVLSRSEERLTLLEPGLTLVFEQ